MLRVDIVDTAKRGRVFLGCWLDIAVFDKIVPRIDWRTYSAHINETVGHLA